MIFEIGQSASLTKRISERDVYLFAEISGDVNSIHVNKVAAEKSIFKKQVAHGLLVGSLISAVLGTKLPGEGAILLEEKMKFLQPVFIGDIVTAQVMVDEIINETKGVIRLASTVANQNKEIVIEGFAIVKVPDQKGDLPSR